MKMIVVALVGALAVSLAIPAMAGPNWHLIQKARKEAHLQAEKKQPEEILPLDHGPRARSIPWLNEQREKEFELMAKSHDKKTSILASHTQPGTSHT